MDITVQLRYMLSYGLGKIVLIFLILLLSGFIGLIVHLIQKAKQKKKNKKPGASSHTIASPENSPRQQMKNSYLQKVDGVEQRYASSQLSQRDCYQELSEHMKNFASEMSGVDVTKMTLMEIGQLGMPELKRLIEEYYEPEFAKESKADVEGAIARTKKVITEWN